MRYLPHTPEEVSVMLKAVGAETLDDLFAHIPRDCVMEGSLNLPGELSEWELNRHLDDLAESAGERVSRRSFLGAGCYDHFVPSAVTSLLGRSEFLTSYTPYQPEVSQGTLQGIYEYQTLMGRLLGMEVANSSLYDGASALAEAVLMAFRVTRKKRAAISTAIHPAYRDVLKTYLGFLDHEIVDLPFGEDGRTRLDSLDGVEDPAVIAVQSPNFFGCIEDLGEMSRRAHERKALAVTTFSEPLAYGLLKSPGRLGADIACGEGRSFGLGRQYGGMTLGIFTSKMEHVRNMPGRIVGKTVDRENREGYVITLSTREQHIRREKATSNICSNQSLCALGTSMYLSLLGKTGIRELSRMNYNKSEYLKTRLKAAGIPIRFESPTFNEFVAEFPLPCRERLLEQGIVPGYPLEEAYPELSGGYLVCATETKTRADLDAFAEEVIICLNR